MKNTGLLLLLMASLASAQPATRAETGEELLAAPLLLSPAERAELAREWQARQRPRFIGEIRRQDGLRRRWLVGQVELAPAQAQAPMIAIRSPLPTQRP